MKNEIMKFLGVGGLISLSKKFLSKKKKKFSEEIFLKEKFHPPNPKNFIFQFLFLLGLNGMIFIFSRERFDFGTFLSPGKKSHLFFKKSVFFI